MGDFYSPPIALTTDPTSPDHYSPTTGTDIEGVSYTSVRAEVPTSFALIVVIPLVAVVILVLVIIGVYMYEPLSNWPTLLL